MKKKRIIITGSVGFIGTALVKYLNKDYNIIGIDRRYPPDNFSQVKNYIHYPIDINDMGTLTEAKNIYAVIHLAASPGVRESHENFKQVCKDNILGTQRIIDRCISDWKPEKLLIASSSSVYGDNGKDGHALREDEIINPRSPYAMSKVANEQLMTTYKNCGLLDGIKTASLRFFTVYGPNQRNELAIRAFTDWILRDEPIILYGTGEQIRDFTHIDDICSGIKALMESDLPHDIYNIGSNDCHSINEIIYLICKITGKNVTINYQPRNMYDVDATLADIDRIFNDTHWQPEINFEDGLRGQIEWQKKQFDSQEFGRNLSHASRELAKAIKGMKK